MLELRFPQTNIHLLFGDFCIKTTRFYILYYGNYFFMIVKNSPFYFLSNDNYFPVVVFALLGFEKWR